MREEGAQFICDGGDETGAGKHVPRAVIVEMEFTTRCTGI